MKSLQLKLTCWLAFAFLGLLLVVLIVFNVHTSQAISALGVGSVFCVTIPQEQ